jgi:hypothetical protein
MRFGQHLELADFSGADVLALVGPSAAVGLPVALIAGAVALAALIAPPLATARIGREPGADPKRKVGASKVGARRTSPRRSESADGQPAGSIRSSKVADRRHISPDERRGA